MRSLQETIAHGVRFWTSRCSRYAKTVLTIAAFVTVATTHYTIENLGINTDTADMISPELDWRQDYISYKSLFPQYSDTLLVVIDGVTPDVADAALDKLASSLSQEDQTIEWVDAPADNPHFRRNGLLYLSIEELESFSDSMAGVQPFIARLSLDPTVAGFADLLGQALAEETQSETLSRAIERVSVALEAVVEGQFHRLSWRELMLGRTATKLDKRRYLTVKPVLDYTDLFPAGPAIEQIRSLAQALQLDQNHGVSVRITGGLALAHEELDSVSRGMGVAGLSAFLMVALILVVGLRSWKLVFASLLTLAVGLLWTAGFAAFAVGHLNLISVAFAVLYIGLGVHYAVHYCLRYQELCVAGQTHDWSLMQTGDEVGRSLVLCALTTGIGFFAFVPTDFDGVSELGLISGAGMFISLLATLSLLPALLRVLNAERAKQMPWSLPTKITNLGAGLRTYPKQVLGVAAIFVLVSLWIARGAEFDRDPINLRDPSTESVATYKDLVAEATRSPLSMVTLVAPADGENLSEQLQGLPEVDQVISISSFVPNEQSDKLFVIEDLAFILALDTLSPSTPLPVEKDIERQRQALKKLNQDLVALDSTSDGVKRLQRALERLTDKFDDSDENDVQLIRAAHQSLLSGLPEQIERLARLLQAQTFNARGLPESIRDRWIAPDGRLRLEIFPSDDLDTLTTLRRFVQAVHSIDPHATDSPVIQLRSGDVVVSAFQQAFATALLCIALVLWILFRRFRDMVLVMLPLLLAGTLTVAATVLLSTPFNFANVITLPLLLGAGVDSGIHLVSRAKIAITKTSNVLKTSTTRAIVVSALTTICSLKNARRSPAQ